MADLSTITVDDFKSLFPRDFPYLRDWNATTSYSIGDQVGYDDKIYEALTANSNKQPDSNPSDWKEIQIYDCDYVTDSDIERAFKEAQCVFNQSLWQDDDCLEQGYLYLTAHYLVMDLKNSTQGLNSSGDNPISSRSVGNVSEGYSVPEWVTKDPILVYYTKTGYGQKYLSLVLPNLMGNVASVAGATLP